MVNYRMGRLPKRIDKRTLQLKDFLIPKLLPPLPDSFDVDSAYPYLVNNHMFGNDRLGDCVISGRAHMTLRFECYEQNKQIAITDQDVENEYFKETGGADTGLNMLDSLNEWRQTGWVTAGNNYDIHAFAEIDITNHQELEYAILLLNGGYTGFNVPQSAMDQFNAGQAWTVVPNDGGIVGGHCVVIKAYNATGPICVTWGRDQQMTWEFWDKYFDEAYAVIDNKDAWINPTIDPVDLTAMDAELAEITASPPNPTPTLPTPSLCPFGNTITKIGNFFCWLLKRKGRFHYLNSSSQLHNHKGRFIKLKAAFVHKNWKQKLGVVFGFLTTMFGLWQMDLIVSRPVWENGWVNNNFANAYFEFGRIGVLRFATTIGTGYDVCQALIVFGFIVTLLSLWLWEE